MIRIAICDDMPDMVETLTEIVHDIIDEKTKGYEIMQFHDGASLLEKINEMDLLFLDIEMPGMDGIQTGAQIIKINPKCKIVIASAREDRMKETFKLQAMRFISKPYETEEIREAIEAYMKSAMLGMVELCVYKNRKQYTVYQRDIQYLKAYNGAVKVVVADNEFRVDMTLNKLEEILDMRLFYRVHKTYIIGLRHVIAYDEKNVMIGDRQIHISRRSKPDFMDALMKFDIDCR